MTEQEERQIRQAFCRMSRGMRKLSSITEDFVATVAKINKALEATHE